MFELIDYQSTKHYVVLSIGSNIGNLKLNIEKAIELLINSNVLQNIHQSSFYLTEPNGYVTERWFMNVSIKAETELNPFALLFFLKSVEYQLGREKSDELSDRIIDIDILFYDTISINTKYLILPHPKMHNRNFMLLPTIELLPNFEHPILQKTLVNVLNDCQDTLKVIKQ